MIDYIVGMISYHWWKYSKYSKAEIVALILVAVPLVIMLIFAPWIYLLFFIFFSILSYYLIPKELIKSSFPWILQGCLVTLLSYYIFFILDSFPHPFFPALAGLVWGYTLSIYRKSSNGIRQKSVNNGKRFDANVIKARVIAYHLNHHHTSNQKVDIFNCHLEYSGGNEIVISVPHSDIKNQSANFYIYNLNTGKIGDIGDASLPRR